MAGPEHVETICQCMAGEQIQKCYWFWVGCEIPGTWVVPISTWFSWDVAENEEEEGRGEERTKMAGLNFTFA